MPKVRAVAQTNIKTGDYSNSNSVSVFGTPGQGTISSGYYRCDIYLKMAICDDNCLYLAMGSGTVSSGHKIGDQRPNWWLSLFGYKSSFEISVSPGENPRNPSTPGKKIYGDYHPDSVEGSTEGAISWTMKPAADAIVGSEIPSEWVKMEPIGELQTSGNTLYYYVCGAITYDGTASDSIHMPSQQIAISDNDVVDLVTDYYPWEHYKEEAWVSHNENGTLHRYDEGWQPTTNSYGDSTSHGYRYSGGWKKGKLAGRGA